MKIGISIPNNWGVADPNRLIDLAVLAEERGLASVWTSEHLINLAYVRARIGERPYYHPLAMLSAVAARTSRIQLGTSVIVMPFHNPFDIAKYIATLDNISRGRVILGVGVGNVPDEFDVLGIPWNKRGKLTDEGMDIIQTLWREDSASHRGETWQFEDVHTAPKSYRGREIPIWVGGMSEAARKRAVRAGHGWQPTAITPDQLREDVGKLRELAEQAGRDPDTLDVCMRFNIALDGVEVTEVELRSTVEGGNRGHIKEIAQSFAEAGATHFIFALNGQEPALLE